MNEKNLRLNRFATASALAALVGWSVAVLAQPVAFAQTNSRSAGFRADRMLVKPKPNTDLTALHARLGTAVLRSFSGIGNLQVLQLSAGADVRMLLSAFQQSGLVEYAEPDFMVQAALEPNDFRYADGSLWALHNTGIYGGTSGADIDAPNGWDIQNTAGNIIVAVIDTGARYTHEDLAANMWSKPGESGRDLLGPDKGNNGADDDGDGMANASEDIAGTNPFSSNSILRVTSIIRTPPSSLSVTWSSVAGKTYQLETAPTPNGTYLSVGPIVTATSGSSSETVTANSSAFYRVRVVP